MKNIKKVAFASQIILLSLLTLMYIVGAKSTQAETLCNFPRDLDLGVEGEDVRCLQKYLNSSGIKIAEEGLGSIGKETNQFRELTKQAVVKWQKANNLSPASGFFGPMSRKLYYQKYLAANPSVLTNTIGTSGTQSGSNTVIDNDDDDEADEDSEDEDSDDSTTVNTNSGGVKDSFLKAIKEIENAEDEIDDSNEAENKIEGAKDDINDAWQELAKAIKAYFNNDTSKAKTFADNAYENASKAFERAGGETKEDEVEELIDEVDAKIDEVNTKIDEANDNDEDTESAEDLIGEAEDLLDEAESALDDEDYDRAEELANEAEDKADDAEDAIGEADAEMEDAENAIEDAKDAIAEARVNISDAQDDDEDTDDAEDLLDEAKDLLKQARDKFDDEDYSKAKSLARSAERKAEDASD